MNTVKILGYSERGVFNSIVFYLREHPELMGKFLTVLGIDLPAGFDGNVEYTLLNEQSFSEFGDSDLVIIAENGDNKKTVVFVEGKVKTLQGKFKLDRHFGELQDRKNFRGISSNIFVQIYHKYLLTQLDGQAGMNSVITEKTLKLGKNEIVLKAAEMIKDAERYYFVAILPLDITSACFQEKFKELALEEMPRDDVRCAYWGKIEELFIDNVVAATFFYNRGQIY
jgi:hypothetical protein